MKKFIPSLIIAICLVTYYCSNSAKITEKYTDYREKRMLLGSDKIGFGGLYGMCYLTDYRYPFSYDIKAANDTLQKNINLYLFSDSYLYYRVTSKHFCNTDKLYKMKWFETETFLKQEALDTTKKNVLVFEMTERYVRLLLENYDGLINMLSIGEKAKETDKNTEIAEQKTLLEKIQTPLINPNINSNLALNLFDYKIFRPLKELKANLNYYVFNRLNEEVFVDTIKKQLYYKPTVAGDQKMNSFYPIDSLELNNLCVTINRVHDLYKTKGFDEIYLAIIPNPVTIINPTLSIYNNLIPTINKVDSLRMKIIDIYSIFKQHPSAYYAKSDSHWNSAGLQLWLDEFNKRLKVISKQNSTTL